VSLVNTLVNAPPVLQSKAAKAIKSRPMGGEGAKDESAAGGFMMPQNERLPRLCQSGLFSIPLIALTNTVRIPFRSIG
jgi:hypothetical protein